MKCMPGGIILIPLNLSPVAQDIISMPNSMPDGMSRKNAVAPFRYSFMALS